VTIMFIDKFVNRHIPCTTSRQLHDFEHLDVLEPAPSCSQDISPEEFARGLCDPFLEFDKTCRKKVENDLKNDPGRGLFTRKVQKICGYSNAVHYELTDLGLDQASKKYSRDHDYVLVTNADNTYHPAFFEKLISTGKSVAASDFLTEMDNVNSRSVATRFKLGDIDLGALIVSMQVIASRELRFLDSIPYNIIDNADVTKREKSVALMRAYHDNDWWFVHYAVFEMRLDKEIVHEFLFNHN
jgi:hypothetical protein